MSYSDFGSIAFFVYLAGCFIAVALSLRSSPDNRVLSQTYGLWITAAYSAHHLLIPHAAQTWHYVWYIWNAVIAAFPLIPAYMLRDAGARRPVAVFGIASTVICLVYALFSVLGEPLPGILYFYGSHICEACQVLSMIIWSGPVVPLTIRAWKFVTKRAPPWMHRAQA